MNFRAEPPGHRSFRPMRFESVGPGWGTEGFTGVAHVDENHMREHDLLCLFLFFFGVKRVTSLGGENRL